MIEPAKARPFVKWAGGKRKLVPDIAQRLPDTINVYWEPFLGGGAVFFALDKLIGTAQLSDINSDLVLTYQMVRSHPDALIAKLEEHASQHSKPYYLKVRKATGELGKALDVAARFIYLNKTCFNGLYRVNKKGQFNVPMGSYKNPAICDADNIRAASHVLNKAFVRRGSFIEVTPSEGDFVYCDPPYDGTFTGYDANGFDEADQRRLRDAVLRWHSDGASVMVSNADTPLIQDLYGEYPFKLDVVSAARNINCRGDGRRAVAELLITTYDY